MNEIPNDNFSDSPTEPPRMSAPSDVQGAAGDAQYSGQFDESPSTWPLVVGIIGMILGILGLLNAGCAPLMQILVSQMPEMQEMMPEVSAGFQIWQFASYAVAGLLSIWLIYASTMLLKRSPKSSGLFRGWSITQLVWLLVATAANIVMIDAMTAQLMPSLEQGGNSIEPEFATIITLSILIGGAIFGLIFPIFCLIWFGRAKTKQDVQSWAR